MIYVCPTPRPLRGRLAPFCRLYAYPAEPEPSPAGGFVILDSGAFGLSKSGERQGMSRKYMRALAGHYARNHAGADFPVVAVAPDVFPNPHLTMRQWEWWYKEDLGPVAPVIQFANKKIMLASVMQQCAFYASWSPPVVFVSNPSVWALDAPEMAIVVVTVRQLLKPRWVHCLGAGWSLADVQAWAKLGFDSIDSVAYYTSAQESAGCWDGDVADDDWRDTAVRNAQAANEVYL